MINWMSIADVDLKLFVCFKPNTTHTIEVAGKMFHLHLPSLLTGRNISYSLFKIRGPTLCHSFFL